jgi:hypothetical protein
LTRGCQEERQEEKRDFGSDKTYQKEQRKRERAKDARNRNHRPESRNLQTRPRASNATEKKATSENRKTPRVLGEKRLRN